MSDWELARDGLSCLIFLVPEDTLLPLSGELDWGGGDDASGWSCGELCSCDDDMELFTDCCPDSSRCFCSCSAMVE